MPDAETQLDAGIRFEAAGALDRAQAAYEAAAGGGAPDVVTQALRRLADVLRTRCEWEAAIEAARKSADAARAAGSTRLEAEALNAEAAVYQSRGDFERATPIYTRMLTLSESPRVRGIALQNLGSIAAQSGDLELAARRFDESAAHFRAGGYARGEVIALNNRGRSLLDQGDGAAAEPILEAALDGAQYEGDQDLAALARLNLADALLMRGEFDRAEDLASAALGYYAVTENRWRRVGCMRLLGDVALGRGNADSARTFFEAGLRVAEELGARVEIRLLRDRLGVSGGG
jgi:tetratricopeptide (TPR) repeat protein